MCPREEIQILKFIDSRREELLDFVRRLVATPSMTPPGDERAITYVIAHEIRRLGLGESEVVTTKPERPNLRI